MNVAGILVVAVGVVLVIIALRGTQSDVFPGLFPKPGTGSMTVTPGGDILGPGISLPDSQGNCPSGYKKITGSAGNILCKKS